jgi:hypothetical protein
MAQEVPNPSTHWPVALKMQVTCEAYLRGKGNHKSGSYMVSAQFEMDLTDDEGAYQGHGEMVLRDWIVLREL